MAWMMMMLRLYVVRGKAAGLPKPRRRRPVADPEVWSKLPEELMWEVVLRLPPAMLFRLHLVSREWRRVLTSADVHARLTNAARSRDSAPPPSPEQQQHVVACVAAMPVRDLYHPKRCKAVVDVDLSSFVPTWFWHSSPEGYRGGASGSAAYSVVAAANGLVCIRNNSQVYDVDWRGQLRARRSPWAGRYCVLNPLTRTCVVLPEVPFQPTGWLPPTSAAVTIYKTNPGGDNWLPQLQLASYDLASGGGGKWVVTVPGGGDGGGDRPVLTAPAVCPGGGGGGETYWYEGGRVRVLEPASTGGGMAAADVAAPLAKVARLGRGACVFLVAHRGALFFAADVWAHGPLDTHEPSRTEVLCGVWRLARFGDGPGEPPQGKPCWVTVARLELEEVRRVTGWPGPLARRDAQLVGVYGVRELLCVQVEVTSRKRMNKYHFVLGFNLDLGRWELVHGEKEWNRLIIDSSVSSDVAKAMELRPDLYVSHHTTGLSDPPDSS